MTYTKRLSGKHHMTYEGSVLAVWVFRVTGWKLGKMKETLKYRGGK